MNLYSATIRLSGNLLHEVNKCDLSPGDLIMLMREHGDDAVVNVAHTSVVDRESMDDYMRLCQIFGEKKVRIVFGERFAARIPTEAVGLSIEPRAMAEEDRPRRTVSLSKGK